MHSAAPTVAQRARVDELVGVDAGDGGAGDVAHVVHARLRATTDARKRRGGLAGGRARGRARGHLPEGGEAALLQGGVPHRTGCLPSPFCFFLPLHPPPPPPPPTMKEVRPRSCRPAMMWSASSSVTPRSCRDGQRRGVCVGGGGQACNGGGCSQPPGMPLPRLPNLLPGVCCSVAQPAGLCFTQCCASRCAALPLPGCWRGW